MAEERKPKRKLAETQKILVDQGIKTRKQITEELDGALAIHEFCSRALTARPCHPLHRLLSPFSALAVIALHIALNSLKRREKEGTAWRDRTGAGGGGWWRGRERGSRGIRNDAARTRAICGARSSLGREL